MKDAHFIHRRTAEFHETDMAGIEPYAEKRLEAHQMRGEEFKIKKEGEDIVEITYLGDPYKLSSVHQGQIFAGGKAYQAQQGKQWFYRSIDGLHHLRLLQIDGGTLYAFAGQQHKEYEFSNILPSG